MRHLNIDIETFSSVDLKKCGLYKYVQSPDFQILLFAYSYDGSPVRIVDLACGERLPAEILSSLTHPDVLKHAYNAAFEWYCISKYLRQICVNPLSPEYVLPLDQWRCTMFHGLYCGYTAGLAATGAALGLPQDKRKLSTGGSLIRTFCVPCKPTRANGNRTRTLPEHEPERWQLFKEYCCQDAVTEMEIERRLSKFPVPDSEQKLWELDQQVNAYGVRVDQQLIQSALQLSETVSRQLMDEAVRISGLNNPNSVSQLTAWLQEELDEEVEDLRKDTVKSLLDSGIGSDTARRMLEIRQELSKTSVKKYQAMADAVCADGRVRGLLQFYGANRTGRWAGRLVQVQNLPRNYLGTLDLARSCVIGGKLDHLKVLYGNVPDILSQLIRTAFIPSKGHTFIVADFSAIEARVLAWLADETWRQQVFATHGKIYEASAASMFGVPVELITKGNPEYVLRQKGKVAELALGYQGSVGALITMGALTMGLTEEELPDIVSRWREANKRICAFWQVVENAALAAVRTGEPVGAKRLIFAREIDYETNQDFLTIQLPSGRKLYYAHPSVQLNQFGREALHYSGLNQTTKKWETISTYGGKLTENIVQAIARDCLAIALQRLAADGYQTVMHVHDEAIVDAPLPEWLPTDEQLDTAVDMMKDACSLMADPIDWAPGLLLRADGFVSNFYRKE